MKKGAFDLLEEFFSKFKKIAFKKGETIIRADEEPRGVFYLKKGYVRLYSLSKNAQELTLIIYKPDDIFPFAWSVNGTQNIYYTEALTAVELYQAPREEFRSFIKTNNEVLFDVTSRFLFRFTGILNRMEYALFGNAYNKVAAIIIICAERFGRKNKHSITIPLPLTHQDIANLLGVARETVSIEMKKLQSEGLIDYKGRYLIIKNMQKLKKESVIG